MTKQLKILAAGMFCGLAAAANAEDLDKGRAIFTETSVPTCSVCHSLADAEAVGEIGPNLDEFRPTFEQVRAAVTSGIGVMPAYGEILSASEIETVSKYVAEVTGSADANTAMENDTEKAEQGEKN